MVDRFPHMDDTEFPGVPDPSNFLDNTFDYSKYDKTQMRIGVCSVPWDVGLIHVGNAQIGGLGNVVYFDSKTDRDAYFDGVEGYVFDTKYREYHSGGHIQIPLPYEKAVLYNYIWVEYTCLPVDYSEGGKDRFFFFIRECESLSPNATKVTILRDTWQTFIYDIDVSYMMLEQGHAPMSLIDADTYLDDPINNNSWLLADDVNYGDSYRRKYHSSVILNADEMLAVIITTSDLSGDWDYKTPDGHAITNGNPSYYAYGLEPGQLTGFLNEIDAQIPWFSQTVQGVFFIASNLVQAVGNVMICGFRLARLEQVTGSFTLADLTKAAFGFGEDYENLAKLYTYPYSYLEIANDSGDVTQLKIEETSGNLSLIVTTSLAYPWIAIDGRLSGVGEGGAALEFFNVTQHTFDIQGSWYDHLHRWQVPIFGITQSAAVVDSYAHMFEREQKRLELDTSLENSLANAGTAYQNAVDDASKDRVNALASAATAKANADAGDNTAYDNALASAATAKANADAGDNTAYDNALASAATAKANSDAGDNTAYDNALASAAVQKTNSDRSAETKYTNDANSAGTSRTNALQDAAAKRSIARNNASTARTNAYNSAETEQANDGLSSSQSRSDSYRNAETNRTVTKETSSTVKNNSDDLALGVYQNAVRDAQANKRKFDNERRLVGEQVEFLTEDNFYFPGLTGYIGEMAWYAREKIGDDYDSDWDMQWYISGQEIYQTTQTAVINAVSGAASTIAGGTISGMAAGPGGAGIGAISGLTTGAVNLLGTSASLPLTISTNERIRDASIECSHEKTLHALAYNDNTAIAEINRQKRFYNIDELWLNLNAVLAEDTAKDDAQRSRDDANLTARRTKETSDANADRIYNTQTLIADADKNTADVIAENTANTAETNADNAYNTAIDNADIAYNAATANAQRVNDTSLTNAGNTRNTALANNAGEYTKDVENATRSRDTGLAQNARTYNTAAANATRSRDTGLAQNARTYNTAAANAARSRDTGLAQNARTYNTAAANATRSRDTGLAQNARTYNTATANAERDFQTRMATAARSKDTAEENAQRSYDAGLAGIQADINQAALNAPVKYGEFADGETSATRPQGLFCNIVTQSRDAIEQTGDHWLRFGYAVNRSWKFETFNVMPHFTYWKASDMWIAGNNVPDAYLDEIRFYLLGGVCVWRNPNEIGRISIYDNMR